MKTLNVNETKMVNNSVESNNATMGNVEELTKVLNQEEKELQRLTKRNANEAVIAAQKNVVDNAKAKLEQTRLEQENMNEQMLLELTQAANNLDEAQLESTIAERSLQQAEENMRVSRSQYDVGLETLSDHLEAQALWQQAYETHVDARFRLYLNYVAYLKATGTLLK